MFADDASIHAASEKIADLNLSLQDGLDDVNDWCLKNCMFIHPDKTKSMVITTRQKHQRTPLLLSLSLGPQSIQQVSEHKVLGLTLDSELNWHSHTNSLAKRLSRNVYLVSRLKRFATKEALNLFLKHTLTDL